MATMIDARPERRGEAKVWESINTNLPESVIVYNNREVDGREYDFCLLCEGSGILIIEVKGWLYDKILVRGIDDIVVEGYAKPQRSPKKQARAYRFSLLNRVTEKFNISPLVCDVVCYPFITQTEYRVSGLDIISESHLTIFKEDLEDEQLLREKIEGVFSRYRSIPHVELTSDVIAKLRQEWEPGRNQVSPVPTREVLPYSILSVHYRPVSHEDVLEIIRSYFQGTKRIVFMSSKQSYKELILALGDAFSAHNIQANSNDLRIGYKSPPTMGNNSTKTFNFEAYYVEGLEHESEEQCAIEEGLCTKKQVRLLEKLASLTTFNYQQYCVEHGSTEDNMLVEAGAGTGKTYSMVSRVAYLCGKRAKPVTSLVDEIAMLTFTNDAATNMKVRLKQMFVNYFILTCDPKYLLFVDEVDQANISTIHSFTIRFLRNDVLHTALGTNFNISSNELTRADCYDRYLSDFLDEMEEENPNFAHEIPVPIYDLKKSLIGIADRLYAKSVDFDRIKAEEMGVSATGFVPYYNDLIERVVIPAERAYSEILRGYNDLDLREAIILFEKVLDQHDESIKTLKFRHLFVDEFQDTDDVQIKVFSRLQQVISADCRFFIVGDLKQSIYRFRGATLSAFERIKNLSKSGWATYSLTTNYRTDKRLLECYHPLFSSMGKHGYLPYKESSDRLLSAITTEIGDEDVFASVEYHGKTDNAFDEALSETLLGQTDLLNSIIAKRADMGMRPLSKAERTIAILVRSNWQVGNVVQSASRKGITVQTNSGGNLFQLTSTHDLYKLVSALRNNTSAVHLVNLIESNFVGLKLDYQGYRDATLDECTADLTRILDEFLQIRMGKTWQDVVVEAYTQPTLFVMKQLYDALQPWKGYSEYRARQRHYIMNYEYLIERIVKSSRVDALTLNQLADYLRVNILTRQEQASREVVGDEEGIRILCTTVHKSKGLEYGTVILPFTYADISKPTKTRQDANYAESRLSYITTFGNDSYEYNTNYEPTVELSEQLSEESRILYVALTRAIRNCIWLKDSDRHPRLSWGSLLEV